MPYDYYVRGGGRVHGPLLLKEVSHVLLAAGEDASMYEAAQVESGALPQESDYVLASDLVDTTEEADQPLGPKWRETEGDGGLPATSEPETSPIALVLYAASLGLLAVALWTTYQDSDYSNKVVGGDAYNFIIFAGRGAVWGLAAVVSAVIASGFHVAHAVKSAAK